MKIGLVLSGGGARGAYEIGVWKALKELGIDKYIKVVAGTSIGALNSVLFVQGDIDFAENIWRTLSREQILKINDLELKLKRFLLEIGGKNIEFLKKYMPKIIRGGSISREGICNLIDKVDFTFIEESNITCYVSCTRVPDIKIKYFKLNKYNKDEIKDILLASSAIPMVFENVKIDGDEYLDGGIIENEPIQPVYGESCDLIIVVHLEKGKKVNRDIYPNTDIIEIMPSIIEDGVFDGVFEFDKDIIINKINCGYVDTIGLIKPIIKLGLCLEQDNIEKYSLWEKIRLKFRR